MGALNISEIVEKRVSRMLRAIRLPFRARLGALNGQPGIQLAQGTGLAGEDMQAVEVLQQFGFTSGVPAGSQLVVLPLAGQTAGSVIIATEHTAYRIQVGNGEVCVYNQWGAKITLKQEQDVEIECKNFRVKASESVDIETKTWRATASGGVSFQTPALAFSGLDGQPSAATLTGNMNIDGAVATTGDQVAAGISQTGHVHGGIEPGGGNTARPE